MTRRYTDAQIDQALRFVQSPTSTAKGGQTKSAGNRTPPETEPDHCPDYGVVLVGDRQHHRCEWTAAENGGGDDASDTAQAKSQSHGEETKKDTSVVDIASVD
jgi:hypothetical protein